MSGGTYTYAYRKIEDLADSIRASTPLRKVFVEHLRKVATACHDIEWVDSGDCNQGSEDAAIEAVLGAAWPIKAVAILMTEAVEMRNELDRLISKAESLGSVRA